MERGSGGGPGLAGGTLIPVSESEEDFQNSILAPLRGAYLYEESKQAFRYQSAVLIRNPALEQKYDACRAKKRERGYSEEDLRETYGFLMFDDAAQASACGETGVLTGNSPCSILGDPSKGVYVSVYSDCLDLNRWYHGKSGYIAIIRLTKGRVKKVPENYTPSHTAPTAGFDCHVSEQLPSVSAETSSFLAFERTQCFMYELLDDGSGAAARSPSLACPHAVVSFSYADGKAIPKAPLERSEEKKQVSCYLLWRGRLQIGPKCYDVGLRPAAGAMMPAQLLEVLKVDRAMPMSEIRKLLPKAVFESCLSGEVFLKAFYCTTCQLVPLADGEASSLSLLLQEMKEKDIAFSIPLNDAGFLILLHPSHFLRYDDTGSNATDGLQGVFVFPDSRVVNRDTKFGQSGSCAKMPAEIPQILPILSYAEGQVEKTGTDPNEELCDVLAHHMQTYATLTCPGPASSPLREHGIFQGQYDVPSTHKHLYSSPQWTKKAWQSLTSYMSKPASFQFPMSKASEIIAAGQDDQREDIDDDACVCLSPPEEERDKPCSMGSGDPLDNCPARAEGPDGSTAVSQNDVSVDLHAGDANKDAGKAEQPVLIQTDDVGTKNLLTHPTSHDLPAELIVSITSEQSVSNKSLSVITAMSSSKNSDLQLSDFTTARLQAAEGNTGAEGALKTAGVLNCPEIINPTKRRRRKLSTACSYGRKKASKASVENRILQSMKTLMDDSDLKLHKDEQATRSIGQSPLNKSSNIDWGKPQRHPGKLAKITRAVDLSLAEKKICPGAQMADRTILRELAACPLRKKTERWDLRPVVSECGRILVPHGCLDTTDQIESSKEKLCFTNGEQLPEKMVLDASANAHGNAGMEKGSSAARETAADETKKTNPKVEGNHCKNGVVGPANPEDSTLRRSSDGKGSSDFSSCKHSAKTDGTDCATSEALMEKNAPTASPGRCVTKGEFLLSKLKHMLSRGKRKTDLLISGETTDVSTQETEPSHKKSKGYSDAEMLKGDDAVSSALNPNVGVKLSKVLSLDPVFAHALGLTPRETEVQDPHPSKDSSETAEPDILHKQPGVTQRPPSIFPKRGRIKPLKKQRGISAENVKRKWWLHFPTSASVASEKLKYKCTRDDSVRRSVEEKMYSACPPTDALNLLADLALSATNDQVPPQPDPAAGRKPESGLSSRHCVRDRISAAQESVLYALLRHPAAALSQPPESPPPSHLVGGSELAGLLSREHAYSLSPSSPAPLGLPITPFQVPSLNGSTRLLHHHKTMQGNGIQTLHLPTGEDDRDKHKTPENPSPHKVFRRKFGLSRSFVDMDGSVVVTRQWKENYDFTLDSRFPSAQKDRAIIRGLHGPWDTSIRDTSEEVRLIVHMWIGLFYSRSTARLFEFDADVTYPSLEETDSPEVAEGAASAPAESEHGPSSVAPLAGVTDTEGLSILNAADLSTKDQRSDILDLSVGNSSAEISSTDPHVIQKETSVPRKRKDNEVLMKPSVGLNEDGKSQCDREKVLSPADPLDKAGCPTHNDAQSFEAYETLNLAKEGRENVSLQPGTDQMVSGAGRASYGSSNEKTETKVSKAAAMTDHEAGDVSHTAASDQTTVRGRENWKVKETSYQESITRHSPEAASEGDSVNKESGTVCSRSPLGDKRQSPRDDPKADSGGQSENVTEENGYFKHKETVIDGENLIKKENGPDQRGSCILTVAGGSDLRDRPLPVDCMTECKCPVPLEEQPPRMGGADVACDSLQSTMLCENCGAFKNKRTTSKKAPPLPSGTDPIHHGPTVEAISDGSVKGAGKAALPSSVESTCALEGSSACRSGPQTKEDVENGSQNKIKANVSSDADSESAEDDKADGTTPKEPFDHQLPQCEIVEKFETKVTLTEERDSNRDGTINGLEKAHCGIATPFMGRGGSRENVAQLHGSRSQGEVEEVVQSQREVQSVSEPSVNVSLPLELHSACQMYSEEAGQSPWKPLLPGPSETNQPIVSSGELADRSPTPTMDEEPIKHQPCSGPSSSSCFALSVSETCKKVTQKSTPDKYEQPNPSCALAPNLDQSTLNITDKVLPNSVPADKSDQFETSDVNHCLEETSTHSGQDKPTCSAASHKPADSEDERTDCEQPVEVLASCSQEVCTKLLSESEVEVQVQSQLKAMDFSVFQHYPEGEDDLQRTSVGLDNCQPSTECVMDIKPNPDQDGCEKTSQAHSSREPHLSGEHPVVAMQPPNSDESLAEGICEEGLLQNSVMSASSKNDQTVPTSISEQQDDDTQEASELSCHSSWSSDANFSKPYSDGAKFSPQDPSLAHSVPRSDSAKSSSALSDGNRLLSTSSSVGQNTKENPEEDRAGRSDALASLEEGNSRLICTVFNSSRKRPRLLLEQLSKRCLQDDLTQASVEQECLIFSDRMRQLSKKSKRRPVTEEASPCVGPVTVQFSTLEEQEDSVDHLDASTLVGVKIKVDMSDKTGKAEAEEDERMLHSQRLSPGTTCPSEHAGVSDVTAECATLYAMMMNDVCAGKRVKERRSSRQTGYQVDKTRLKSEPSNHSEYCAQVKRHADESCGSNLNAVVKKSCATKKRFFILVTSGDAIFEETRARLEAEDHTAVQPSKFFLGKESTSPLLIVLRNEDIAEHICEIPHLLELKKSPSVRFAGIDEADDVANRSYQELFTRGGFLMLDQSALDLLSLRDMRRLSEVLRELSKTGKWKWMLHYRDTRQLKKDARFSEEAKEKRDFFNGCRDGGLLEALPYHECDHVSRDRPDYLACMVHLQLQNIWARYPVFVTDSTDGEFGRNGILTMTVNSFLANPPGGAPTT